MAVEKSYARLGLFLVVALVVVLATAVFFIQRLRSREVIAAVTYTTENVSGLEVSSPVRYRGVSVGRVADVRVDPRSNSIEIDFEIFLDRLITIGDNVKRTQAAATWRHIRKTSGPGSAQSRDRRGVLVARPAGERPATDRARVHTGSGIRAVDAHDAFEGRGSAAGASGARALTLQTLREIINRIPDSLDRSDRFFTNIERIIQESEIPALSADSRKFLATTGAQLEQIEQITPK